MLYNICLLLRTELFRGVTFCFTGLQNYCSIKSIATVAIVKTMGRTKPSDRLDLASGPYFGSRMKNQSPLWTGATLGCYCNHNMH